MRFIFIIILALTLTSCAGFKNHEIKFGKACFEKPNGTITWSYVWIKDKKTTFDKCPDVKR